jgi:hypothetical protein
MVEARPRTLNPAKFICVANSHKGKVFLNGAGGNTGMLSYPNFGGPLKIFQYPDVRLLAEVAERAEVDLRIVVLHREAADLLHSTTGHRHFARYGQEAIALAHSARVLAAQLRSMDREFFLCVPYSRLPKVPRGFEAWMLGEKNSATYQFKQKIKDAFTKGKQQSVASQTQKVDNGVLLLQGAIDELKKAADC